MAETAIEWTHRPGTTGVTWNPSTGCDRISPGCDHCYALTLAKRLKGMGSAKYQTDGDPRTSGPGFGLAVHTDALDEPLRWRKPRTVFVNSMSDLFHARVPHEFIVRVFAVMAATPQHTYQILTKRPERLRRLLADDGDLFSDQVALACEPLPGRPAGYAWPLSGVWLGTSVESDAYARRVDELRATPAAVRFVSAEPLLGPLPSLDLTGISWLIIGGESGPGARPLDLNWVRDLIYRARSTNTAVFVKQLGSMWARDTFVGGQSVARTDPKGGDWKSWPADLRIRDYPPAPVAPGVAA